MTRAAALAVLMLALHGCTATPRYEYAGPGNPPAPLAQAQARCTSYGPVSPESSGGAFDSLRRSGGGDTLGNKQAGEVAIENCLRAAGWRRRTAP